MELKNEQKEVKIKREKRPRIKVAKAVFSSSEPNEDKKTKKTQQP